MVLAPFEWYNLLSPYKLRCYLAFKRDPKYRELYEITFSENGLHYTTPTIDSNIAWSFYHSLLEDDELFLLVYGNWMYSVIPKRAFSDIAELNAFRELANARIGQPITPGE